MITSKSLLIDAIQHYHTPYKEEQALCSRFIDLLKHDDSYSRHHLPGHLTGSAFILDTSHQHVLLTHHAKLNKWLQPGGHADGDENIFGVALREAEEETGLLNFTLLREGVFDIDIHTIPERKDFTEHFHYDVRFLFEASKTENLVITEESHDLAWVRLDAISHLTNHNAAIMRMVEKVALL